jgi:type II secretory pathway component PulF
MPIYYCRVLDARGRTNSFVREAASEEVLIRELNKEDIFPLEVREAAEAPKESARRKKLSRAAVIEFTDTISMLPFLSVSSQSGKGRVQAVFRIGYERIDEVAP